MKRLIPFTVQGWFWHFSRLLSAQKIIRLQNNLTLISYRNRRYHSTAGANCQSACLNYLPDRGNLAVRRGRVAPVEVVSPHVGRVIQSYRAGLGSGVDRTAQ